MAVWGEGRIKERSGRDNTTTPELHFELHLASFGAVRPHGRPDNLAAASGGPLSPLWPPPAPLASGVGSAANAKMGLIVGYVGAGAQPLTAKHFQTPPHPRVAPTKGWGIFTVISQIYLLFLGVSVFFCSLLSYNILSYYYHIFFVFGVYFCSLTYFAVSYAVHFFLVSFFAVHLSLGLSNPPPLHHRWVPSPGSHIPAEKKAAHAAMLMRGERSQDRRGAAPAGESGCPPPRLSARWWLEVLEEAAHRGRA